MRKKGIGTIMIRNGGEAESQEKENVEKRTAYRRKREPRDKRWMEEVRAEEKSWWRDKLEKSWSRKRRGTRGLRKMIAQTTLYNSSWPVS